MNQQQKYPATEAREGREAERQPASSQGIRLLSSADLLEGRRQLRIEHQGEIYTLRVTSKGKLILTK
ncbi:Hemin uptake protein HemP [Ectothiorhodospira magna]|uniref:Hemin uptake protein HemP n=2 Tax=Ectothiorhodospira magna TaxID=867345 RepID=A0A1H9CUD1_9GAMM|nr:Hemin uptake protein HemP [Ectothiorhodospira magna]